MRKVNAEDKKAVAEKPHRDGREYCARLDGYGKISDEMQWAINHDPANGDFLAFWDVKSVRVGVVWVEMAKKKNEMLGKRVIERKIEISD